tara:strand:- start:296 stop:694 length:399 start_codon:yes stop_codon:yes gene_type:complete
MIEILRTGFAILFLASETKLHLTGFTASWMHVKWGSYSCATTFAAPLNYVLWQHRVVRGTSIFLSNRPAGLLNSSIFERPHFPAQLRSCAGNSLLRLFGAVGHNQGGPLHALGRKTLAECEDFAIEAHSTTA